MVRRRRAAAVHRGSTTRHCGSGIADRPHRRQVQAQADQSAADVDGVISGLITNGYEVAAQAVQRARTA